MLRRLKAANADVAAQSFRKTRRGLRSLWKRYLSWPAPIWQLQGYARLPFGGQTFAFPVADESLWWLRRVAQDKWERPVRDFLRRALRPGDVFFDIGAWIGPYSLLAAKLVEPGGRVYAFEPDPVARSLLERALAANRVSNVTIVPHAVLGEDGTVWLASGRLGGSESTVRRDTGQLRVQGVSLRRFCEQVGVQPAVIKMNAMGHEPEIVADAMDILRRTRVIVVTLEEALLRASGADPTAYVRLLCGLGRPVVVLDQKHRAGTPAGTRLIPDSVATGYMKLALADGSA